MKLITLGVAHKTTPVELREQLAVERDELAAMLHYAVQHPNVTKCVVLSTCNRVELYAAVVDQRPVCFLKAVLTRSDFARRADLEGRWIDLNQPASIRHLFQVTAGLDAMVVGEQ